MTQPAEESPEEEAGETPAQEAGEHGSAYPMYFARPLHSIDEHEHKLKPTAGSSQHHKSPPAHTHRDEPPPLMGPGRSSGRKR